MGLLDNLSDPTVNAGLLGMGAGLLSGSTGHYGAFAPALGAGFAGMQAAQMNQQRLAQNGILRAAQMQRVQQQIRQDADAQRFFGGPSTAGATGAQTFPVSPSGASPAPSGNTAGTAPNGGVDDAMISRALMDPNPKIRQWGLAMQTNKAQTQRAKLQADGINQNAWSSPVQTSQGFGQVNRVTGEFRPTLNAKGEPVMPTTIDVATQGAVADAKGFGKTQGTARATNQAALPNVQANLDQMINTVDLVKNSPGKKWSTGWASILPTIPGSDQVAFRSALDQIKGQTFLQAYNTLKGGGQITEVEGEKATQAMARLNTAQSEKDFDAALDDLRGVLGAAKNRMSKTAGVAPDGGAEPSSNGSNQEIRSIMSANDYAALPSGTLFKAPDGTTRRKP